MSERYQFMVWSPEEFRLFRKAIAAVMRIDGERLTFAEQWLCACDGPPYRLGYAVALDGEPLMMTRERMLDVCRWANSGGAFVSTPLGYACVQRQP